MSVVPGVRRRVGEVGLAALLRRLRGRERLVALVGEWDGGCDLVAYDPVRVLREDADPFDLGTGPRGARDPGTWLGWWGYRLGRRLEEIGPPPPRPYPLPDADFALYDTVLRRVDGTWWFESEADLPAAERRWATLRGLLDDDEPSPTSYGLAPFEVVPGVDAHRDAVARAVEHIHAGDIFQANICLRLESRFTGDALEMFLAGVGALAPAYAAYVAGSEATVVSLSPELYLRRTGDQVVSSPIKGTAPADTDPASLEASVKNRAENVMIVDLVRNDLGRVAATGSVQVTATAAPRHHTGVWHLVSDVEATLLPGMSDNDLLRASFPPGSVTGAPKIRAMQIIGELETVGREVYTGAIGYAGPRGLEANVAIRTFEIRDDRVWLGVGGGVVADSDPDDEVRECFTKALPLLNAVGGGLDTPSLGGSGYSDSGGGEGGGPARWSSRATNEPVSRPAPSAGIFDTLLVRDGIPLDLEGHVGRFVDAAAASYGIVIDRDDLATRAQAIASDLVADHRLRFTLDPRTAAVEVSATPAGAIPSDPWVLVPAVVPGGLGNAKWSDRRLLDRLPGAPWGATHDPLLVDTDGTVLESGRGNLFVVRDDGVHTPALDGRILPGVTRAVVLGLLRDHGVPVFERTITVDELALAAELFVTNAIGRIRPVVEVSGVVRREPGPTTAWLKDLDSRSRQRDQLVDRMQSPDLESGPDVEPRVLLIDNYDSFVHNLAQYLRELGADATVVRNDALTVDDLRRLRRTGDITHLVISPGPGAPSEAGVSVDAVRALGPTTPILGVCLGHQAIGEAYGARVVRAPRPVHGVPSLVHHDGKGVFEGLDNGPLVAARYHSLIVEDLPDDLMATAWNAEGVLMGVRHRVHPVEGVQIHPESILTPRGHDLLAAFLSRTSSSPG